MTKDRIAGIDLKARFPRPLPPGHLAGSSGLLTGSTPDTFFPTSEEEAARAGVLLGLRTTETCLSWAFEER